MTDTPRGPTIEESNARYADIKAAQLFDVIRQATDPYTYPAGQPSRDEAQHSARIDDGKSNQVMRKFFADAEALVCGTRQDAYDVPEINHARTAGITTLHLGVPIDAQKVCGFNLCQKLSRLSHKPSYDTLLDIAGYAANYAAIMAAELPVNGT